MSDSISSVSLVVFSMYFWSFSVATGSTTATDASSCFSSCRIGGDGGPVFETVMGEDGASIIPSGGGGRSSKRISSSSSEGASVGGGGGMKAGMGGEKQISFSFGGGGGFSSFGEEGVCCSRGVITGGTIGLSKELLLTSIEGSCCDAAGGGGRTAVSLI